MYVSTSMAAAGPRQAGQGGLGAGDPPSCRHWLSRVPPHPNVSTAA